MKCLSLFFSSYEYVTEAAANAIVTNPPQCLIDYTYTPGATTLHVYVDTYVITCLQGPNDASVPEEERERPPVLPGERGY